LGIAKDTGDGERIMVDGRPSSPLQIFSIAENVGVGGSPPLGVSGGGAFSC